jgi:tetratricopeptide (TPR) repeat protein
LGDALGNLHHLPEAEDALKKARRLFQQLTPARFAGDPFFPRQRAAVAMHKLAMVKLAGKDLKETEVYLRHARDEMEPVLKARPHVTQFQILVAYIEHDLARLLHFTRPGREAEEGFRRAFDLRLKLATNYPTVRAYRQRLIDSLHHLDECLQQSGKPAEGLALFEELVKDYPTVPEYQLALAHALSNRGGFLFLQKQWQKGEELLRRALRLEEKLSPQSPEVLEAQCRTLQSLVFVAHVKRRPEEAEKFARAHLALRKKWFAQVKDEAREPDPVLLAFYARHAKKDMHYDVGRPAEKLAASYAMLGQLLEGARRWQEMSDLLEEALKVVPKEASLNNAAAWFLATCPAVKLRDPARAVSLAEKALAVDRKEPHQVLKTGDIWNTLGVARYRAGHWQAAVEALEQSRKLREGGDAVDWLFLAMAHQKLGHAEQAGKCYAQAVQWLKNNPQALTDPGQAEQFARFRKEGEEVLGQKKK